MSLEMHTYVPSVDDSLIPRWLSEIRKLGMECEMHPEISLISHSGFLPFKIRIKDSAHQHLNGVEFLTGFEYYISDFSLEAALGHESSKPGALARIFGKKLEPKFYASTALDEKLRKCRKLLTFSWGSADLFELRMAAVSSALLADITGGVSSYPADGIWYDPPLAAQALGEARDYENSLKQRDIKVHKFEGWL